MRLVKKCKLGSDVEQNTYVAAHPEIIVTPNYVRQATFDEWAKENQKEREERERLNIEKQRLLFEQNIRNATTKAAPYVAGVLGAAAAPGLIEGVVALSPYVGSAIRTGLKAADTAFTPSSWLNPVTGKVLFNPTTGQLLDAGIQSYFITDGITGLYNQANKGTLLSDVGNTVMHTMEAVPLTRLASSAIKMGLAKLPMVRKPFGTSSVPLIASDNPFNDTDDANQFIKLLYNRKIAGKSMLPGEEGFASDVTKGLPAEVQLDLMNSTVARNIREFEREGYDQYMNQLYKDKVLGLLDNVNVGMYSRSDYEKAGMGNNGGFFDKDRNFISINTGSGFPEGFIAKHEGRHLIDYNTSMLDSQMEKLKAAYDDDFIYLPKTMYGRSFKGYKLMDKERVTTNRDAREVLLGKVKNKLTPDLLDKAIDKASDLEIFKAVENANNYGRGYIRYLMSDFDNYKATPEKAQLFREAMKHVGGYALPITLGGYGIYQNDKPK